MQPTDRTLNGDQRPKMAINCTHMAQALIVADPKITMGKPTVAGTRITVELMLEKLAAGETVEQILAAHRRLTDEGIRAALAFAAAVLGAEVVYPMENVHARRSWRTRTSTRKLSTSFFASACCTRESCSCASPISGRT